MYDDENSLAAQEGAPDEEMMEVADTETGA